jgi:hypothetical protein
MPRGSSWGGAIEAVSGAQDRHATVVSDCATSPTTPACALPDAGAVLVPPSQRPQDEQRLVSQQQTSSSGGQGDTARHGTAWDGAQKDFRRATDRASKTGLYPLARAREARQKARAARSADKLEEGSIGHQEVARREVEARLGLVRHHIPPPYGDATLERFHTLVRGTDDMQLAVHMLPPEPLFPMDAGPHGQDACCWGRVFWIEAPDADADLSAVTVLTGADCAVVAAAERDDVLVVRVAAIGQGQQQHISTHHTTKECVRLCARHMRVDGALMGDAALEHWCEFRLALCDGTVRFPYWIAAEHGHWDEPQPPPPVETVPCAAAFTNAPAYRASRHADAALRGAARWDHASYMHNRMVTTSSSFTSSRADASTRSAEEFVDRSGYTSGEGFLGVGPPPSPDGATPPLAQQARVLPPRGVCTTSYARSFFAASWTCASGLPSPDLRMLVVAPSRGRQNNKRSSSRCCTARCCCPASCRPCAGSGHPEVVGHQTDAFARHKALVQWKLLCDDRLAGMRKGGLLHRVIFNSARALTAMSSFRHTFRTTIP